MPKLIKYERVLPRDFFNEAKLLKCLGQLALKAHDRLLPEGVTVDITENGKPFEIGLTEDGSLTLVNYKFEVNGKWVVFKTTYNSKSNYPLYMEDGYEEWPVFDEQGEFTEEFIVAARSLK